MPGREDSPEETEFEVDDDEVTEAREVRAEGFRAIRGDQGIGFRMPSGFSTSLMPGLSDLAAQLVAPLNERLLDQMAGLIPDLSEDFRGLLDPLAEQLIQQSKSAMPSIEALALPSPTTGFSDLVPPALLNLPALDHMPLALDSLLKSIGESHTKLLEGLHTSIAPLIDPELLRGFRTIFLPPNLQDVDEDVRLSDVHAFLEQEGIPLYLVPRGRIALRLLRANDRDGRRRVLGECFHSLMDDCEDVLRSIHRPDLREAVLFTLDGLGAMRAGHTRSAQAMFTVTLDSLIYRLYPEPATRRTLTNRKKGAEVPDSFDEMGVREAMVWLPIWNAHEQFWNDRGDRVPHYYSRHASVHAVSSRQFSKRNCVQVLMLVTSLIGYASVSV